jgi:hypothetical protein
VRRTWKLLNEYIPGHKIPIKVLEDFISSCVWCQKVRMGMADSLQAPIRCVETEHPRHLCGYDTLYVTPPCKEGYKYLHVFRMIPSRLVALYPSKDLSAESLAMAAFQFFLTYGISDVLITDPGSNINSSVVKHLLSWFGIRLRMSLVNRHQSNMVERSHRETLRFLRNLVQQERVKDVWSKPHILGIVQFIMNSETSKETSISPFQYVFGSLDSKYLKWPSENQGGCEYVDALDQDLRLIREEAQRVQQKEQERRRQDLQTGVNEYAQGDLVLVKNSRPTSKLCPVFLGPYEVTSVYKADVTVKHLVNHVVKVHHMDDIKPFFGPREDAMKAALVDNDQFVVKEFLEYKGDPERRTSMEFLVKFEDDDEVWIPWNRDVIQSQQFESFCRSQSQLVPLVYTEAVWKTLKRDMDAKPIAIDIGSTCFVDLSMGLGIL